MLPTDGFRLLRLPVVTVFSEHRSKASWLSGCIMLPGQLDVFKSQYCYQHSLSLTWYSQTPSWACGGGDVETGHSTHEPRVPGTSGKSSATSSDGL